RRDPERRCAGRWPPPTPAPCGSRWRCRARRNAGSRRRRPRGGPGSGRAPRGPWWPRRGCSEPGRGCPRARRREWRPRWTWARSSAALHVLLLAGVVAEGPGGRELAELVPHHRLGDVDGHVLAPVVDGDGVADHLGDDRGPARPRPDHPLLAG